MPEGLFRLLHFLLLVFSTLVVFGIPLLLLFLLARWLDKRRQRRNGIRVSIVAVVIGGITYVIASTILSIPMAVYVMMKLHEPNRPVGSASAAIVSASHSLYWLQLLMGLACSGLGGYVAAWVAKHDELLNGLLSAFACIALWSYSLLASDHFLSVPAKVSLLLGLPAFALLGGFARQKQKIRGTLGGIGSHV